LAEIVRTMPVLYALLLLIAIAIAWLVARHVLDRRRERLWRDRLTRLPSRPRFKRRADSERSEMRANDDPTTVATTIAKRARVSSAGEPRAADGTRSKSDA
jgi:hypothetical protein